MAFVIANGGDPKTRFSAAVRIFEGWAIATYWDGGPWRRGLPVVPRTRQRSTYLRDRIGLRKVTSSGHTELRDYVRFRRVMRALDIDPPTAQGGRLADWASDRRRAWRDFRAAIERADGELPADAPDAR